MLLPLASLVLGIANSFPLRNLLRASVFHTTATIKVAACSFEVLRHERTEPLPSRSLILFSWEAVDVAFASVESGLGLEPGLATC